jgi:uncharacterized membrane protein (Fun14 family)
MSISETLAVTIGGAFFGGILIGYAMKKVIKIAAVVVGLFLGALAYLQYQQIIDINWNKLQTVSQNALIVLANTISHIPSIGTSGHATAFAMSSFGIPLTGSISMGFAIGFMKG